MTDGWGTFGASHGEGQVRFWLWPAERLTAIQLYDRVAGLLLREVDERALVSALYLYPWDPAGEASAIFMLLLAPRAEGAFDLGAEYERLIQLVIEEVADPGRDHFPATQ